MALDLIDGFNKKRDKQSRKSDWEEYILDK